MTNNSFFLQLAGVTMLTAVVLFGLFRIPLLSPYQALAWASLAGFVALSVIMFFSGRNSAMQENKNTFTTTVLGFTMGKMMMAAIVLFAYLKLAEPTDKYFVIPFFIIYFIFTAFETYFMMKLGKTGV